MRQELITLILEQQALHIFSYTQRFQDSTPTFYACIPTFQDKGIIFQLPILMDRLRSLHAFSTRNQPLTAIALLPVLEVVNTVERNIPSESEQILNTSYSCVLDPSISLWYHCTFSALSLLQLQLLALKTPYRCIALTSFTGALIRYLSVHLPSFAWTMELNNQLPLLPQLEEWCKVHTTTRLHTVAEGLRIIANEEV
jgi:hypothetical protein